MFSKHFVAGYSILIKFFMKKHYKRVTCGPPAGTLEIAFFHLPVYLKCDEKLANNKKNKS